MNNQFTQKLFANIIFNHHEYGIENYDQERFGAFLEAQNWKKKIINYLDPCYQKNDVNVYLLPPNQVDFAGLEETYALLADEESKELLVKVIEYRVLGYKRVKIPVNLDENVTQRVKLSQQEKESIDVSYLGMTKPLMKFCLEHLGEDVAVYGTVTSIATFLQGHYEYQKNQCKIVPQEGDIVIDGGACWGEAALFFANMVGAGGEVYSFEFVPENLHVFQKNIELNPRLKDQIHIVKHAMLNESDLNLNFGTNGPATRIVRADDPFLNGNGEIKKENEITTLSIDDLVQRKNLSKVDFIKMDIEGCELLALKGAEKTLRTFQPKLAISLYHKNEDFVEIPKYLQKLGLGYKFYLGHYTIHAEETVLYAVKE